MRPLQVAILRDGNLSRTVEIPDPRDEFCRGFNELGHDGGLTAVPIEEDEVAGPSTSVGGAATSN